MNQGVEKAIKLSRKIGTWLDSILDAITAELDEKDEEIEKLKKAIVEDAYNEMTTEDIIDYAGDLQDAYSKLCEPQTFDSEKCKRLQTKLTTATKLIEELEVALKKVIDMFSFWKAVEDATEALTKIKKWREVERD